MENVHPLRGVVLEMAPDLRFCVVLMLFVGNARIVGSCVATAALVVERYYPVGHVYTVTAVWYG